MRVAHVSAAMQHGGAERVLIDLARTHAREGLQVAIVAPPGPLDRDWAALGIDRVLFAAAERHPVDVVQAARAVRTALSAFRPDVVHAHNVKATALALMGTRVRAERTPVLATFHGVPARQMWASARILRFADTVAAVSDELRKAAVASGLPPERITVVHNGVAAIPVLEAARRVAYDRELELRGGVVAAVGRLAPQKAHDRFLAAAALVLEGRPETTFLIIGDGELRRDLERQAVALGIEHAVRFTGTRQDARALIARADLLVFSSNWEGLSIAALEALAAGTPVVSTDVAGMRELLDTGAGTIVPGRDPTDLAAAVTSLLGNGSRRRAMGIAGRRLVAERFSTAAMANRYAALYTSLSGCGRAEG
jgi:glycosyltransferase involved in cell wall biosynthesis